MAGAMQTDVLVVGSGVAGLAAAVSAAERGAAVMVCEKQRALGGTSNFFQGTFAVESELQRADFVRYTRDEAFKNIMEYSHWRADARLVRAIVDRSAETIAWLQGYGVELAEVMNNMPDAPRTYHLLRGGGEAVVKALASAAKARGADIRTAAPVAGLLKTGPAVTGAIVDLDGDEIEVAAGAVVVASGGYAANKQWVKKYGGLDLGVNVIPMGNVGKMGDGIRMAWEAGAGECGIGVLELFRVGPIGPGHEQQTPVEYAGVQPELWVDTEGRRFCDETIGFYETSVGNASARTRQWCNYTVFDTSAVERLATHGIDKAHGPGPRPGSPLPTLQADLERLVAQGDTEVFGADSVAALAEKMGVPVANLESTVAEYNRFCAQRHDDLFAKDPAFMRPLVGPRFYAIRARTICLGTMGGIRVDERCQALDTSGKPIPGLYAAGYDAGGMYGDSYPIRPSSGLSSAFAINSGRAAGSNAATDRTGGSNAATDRTAAENASRHGRDAR